MMAPIFEEIITSHFFGGREQYIEFHEAFSETFLEEEKSDCNERCPFIKNDPCGKCEFAEVE